MCENISSQIWSGPINESENFRLNKSGNNENGSQYEKKKCVKGTKKDEEGGDDDEE